MLIGYSRPADIAWTLVGTDADFVGENTLTNGQPRDVTRMLWPTGTQTISSALLLQGSWASAIVPRIIAVLGLSVPAGQHIEVRGRRAADGSYTYALGGNAITQRSVQFADGSVGLWIVCDEGLDPIIGIEIMLFNDLGGSAVIGAGEPIDIGEVWVSAAVDVPIDTKWSAGQGKGADDRRSITDQPWPVRYIVGRDLVAKTGLLKYADVYATPSVNAVNFARLGRLIGQGQTCVALPRWKDADALQATALLGQCGTFDLIDHLAGPHFSAAMDFAEAPALPQA